MNKATREQIEHRAIEILSSLDDKESDCDYCRVGGEDCCHPNCARELMLSALEQAEDELTPHFLTSKQKIQLKNRLEELEKATKHKYISFTYYNDISDNKFVNLEYEYIQSEYRIDVIHVPFVSFADKVFESGKEYNIEDLLNG